MTGHQLSRQTAYRKRYEYLRYRGIPTGLVGAGPVVAHIQRMVDLSWSFNSLSAWTNGELSHHTFRLLLSGRSETVERRTQSLVAQIPYTLAVPDHMPGNLFVAPLGMTRRVRALYAIGWTREALMDELATPGVSIAHAARGARNRVQADRWRAIDGLYQRLHLTPGPSVIARQRAIANGYAPPLAFNDIDNPTESPKHLRHSSPQSVDQILVARILGGDSTVAREATPFERMEVVRRWAGSETELNAITGWNVAREKRRLEDAASELGEVA